MLKATARRLITLNLSVFLCVLFIGSLVIYFSVAANIDKIKREQLRILGDAVKSSIEAPDEGPHEIPDIFRTEDVTDPEKEQF